MTNEQASAATEAMLSPIEARLIGALMEKQRTTPDQYPLTLNGLVTACNQKTARQPLMNLSPGEVGHALNALRDRGLIHASFNGRTERYDHKLVGTFLLSREEQALLCALMLRGPQTIGELRTNTARLMDFADLDSVSKALQSLISRDRPLVIELARQAGRREERYAHLLCGQPAIADTPTTSPPSRRLADSDEGQRDGRIHALETEVASLRAELDRLWELTGLADQRPPH